MDLSEFISESLTEIISGIKTAQEKPDGQLVGAEMFGAPDKGLLLHGGTAGLFTVVDFDVSVVAETKAGGKAGIRVWGIGAEGAGERTSQQTSKVKFSVQLKIPKGEPAPRRVPRSSD